MKKLEVAKEWIKRAKSNLAMAKAGRVSQDILFEDLCFDAQQAVEKGLKSLCIANEVVFPKTHDIAYLLELLEKGGIEVPEEVLKSKLLTDYAVQVRYPGEYEPVTETEYLKTMKIAETALNWVEKKVGDIR